MIRRGSKKPEYESLSTKMVGTCYITLIHLLYCRTIMSGGAVGWMKAEGDQTKTYH